MHRDTLDSNPLASMGIDVPCEGSEPRRAVLRRGSLAPSHFAAMAIVLPGKNAQPLPYPRRAPEPVEADPLLLALVVAFYFWLAYLLIKGERERSKTNPERKDSE